MQLIGRGHEYVSRRQTLPGARIVLVPVRPMAATATCSYIERRGAIRPALKRSTIAAMQSCPSTVVSNDSRGSAGR
jgi:hypothetical protein